MDHLSPGAGYGGDHHARGPTSGSYQDSAYAPAGSQSRMNSAGGTQSQPYTSRIQPPEYGVPPPPPRPNGASIGEGGYPRAAQVANGNGQPAAYPTYAPQQQSTQHQHHHPFQHHPAKPVPPVEEVGRGWAGFSLQDIRDLSPKAKKRLIW